MMLDAIGRGLDKFVGVFSPQAGYKRARIRQAARAASPGHNNTTRRRSDRYAAAKTDRLTGAWAPSEADVNRIIGLSSPAVRARVRQLVRDFPYFSRAVKVLVDYTVGPGIVLQAKVRTTDGRLARRANQQIEDAFAFWADEADVAKKLHFYEMMQLAKRGDVESGEFVMVKRFRPNEGRYLPYVLQAYEADWLTTQFDMGYGPRMAPGSGSGPDVDIYQGIEYHRDTGEVLAYHFTDPDGWGKPIRIEAKDVIHGFETVRPGQLRGISPFAPAVLVTRDLSEYMDAEIDAAKMASKILGSIKSANPMGMVTGWTTEIDEETGAERQIEELENAVLKILHPGEEMDLHANPRPSDNFPPFVRLVLCMVAVTTGVPYELLSGDYQGMSWSTAKIVRTDFAQCLRPVAARHVRHFCTPAVRPFFDYAAAYGKVSLPGYFYNPARYLSRIQWQPPGMESVDFLRETKAVNDQIAAGLRSPQEHAASRGRDLEDIYKEIRAARELAEEMGLSFSQPSTALANNPKAVEEDQ